MFQNIVQCTGQAPTTEDHPGQNANSAEVEKPGLGDKQSGWEEHKILRLSSIPWS